MKVEIYGNSIAAACSALKAYEFGFEVTWFCKKDSAAVQKLRPTRLKDKHVSFLFGIARSHSKSLNVLNRSQEISAYSTFNTNALKDLWKQKSTRLEYWVDAFSVFNELKSAAENTSINILNSEIYPKYMGNTANISIVDAPDSDLNLWSPQLFDEKIIKQKIKTFSLQCYFTKNPRQKRSVAKIFKINNSLGFLEPSGMHSGVLSLYTNSKQQAARNQSLFSQNQHQNKLPLDLRVLFTLNPGSIQRRLQYEVGQSAVFAPGLFPIGQGIGVLNPENNQQDLLGLDHLIELLPLIKSASPKKQVKVYKNADQWILTQRRSFQRHLYLSNLWKKALISKDSQRLALSAHSLLPPFLRESLASPL